MDVRDRYGGRRLAQNFSMVVCIAGGDEEIRDSHASFLDSLQNAVNGSSRDGMCPRILARHAAGVRELTGSDFV